jgi:toxin ParE1/3/4
MYKLTRKAVDDIIVLFVEGARRFGIEQAERYHGGLERVLQMLSDNPELARERLEITPPVRVHPHGSHLVVYTVTEDRDVLIVRVRHGHEDWQDQLSF